MPSTAAGSTFATTLKEMRDRRGATQAEVADAVGVSRATIAQWEAARHLPGPDRAEALDEFLDGHGTLRRLADDERRSQRMEGGTGRHEHGGINLFTVYPLVEAALDDHLVRDDDGEPIGWRQNLQMRDKPPTTVSTAFGVKLVRLMGEAVKVELGPLCRRLLDEQEPDGGWRYTAQLGASPEATAIVIDAIVRVDLTSDISHLVDVLEKTVDDVTWQRPYIMATVLETALDLRPDSTFTARLVRGLLEARIDTGDQDGSKLWGEKYEPGMVAPSVFDHHTARSVCALARARSLGAIPEDLVGAADDAIGAAVDWLKQDAQTMEGARLEATSEVVARDVRDTLYLRHFTAPFLVRALLLAGEPVTSPSVDYALRQVWKFYDHDHSLWRWTNGDLPVWMTLEAIAALRLAALAAFFPR